MITHERYATNAIVRDDLTACLSRGDALSWQSDRAVAWLAGAVTLASVEWFGQDMSVSETASEMPGSDSTVAEIAEFVGGMNVPSRLGGRLNTTIPTARLTITHRTLQMQPRFPLALMYTGFEVPLREIAVAFPLSGTFMTTGVGFALSDGLLAYFWTRGDKNRVLEALDDRGVVIDLRPRRAHDAMTGQFERSLNQLGLLINGGELPSPSWVAETPRYSPHIRGLFPLFIVSVILIFVSLTLDGTTFGWALTTIGVLGVVQSFRALRRHR